MIVKQIEWNEEQVALFYDMVDQVIRMAPDSRKAAQQIEPLAKSVDDAGAMIDAPTEEQEPVA